MLGITMMPIIWVVITESGNVYKIDQTGYWMDARDRQDGFILDAPKMKEGMRLLEVHPDILPTIRTTTEVVKIESIVYN